MRFPGILGLLIPIMAVSCSDDAKGKIERYINRSSVVTIASQFKVLTMVASPEFLAGIRSMADGDALGDRGRLETGATTEAFHIIYLGIESANEGDPNVDFRDGRQVSELSQKILRNGLTGKFRLRLEGGEMIQPISYHEFRHSGTDRGTEFLFFLPKIRNGKRIELSGSTVIMDEFGLNIGRLEHRIKTPTGLW